MRFWSAEPPRTLKAAEKSEVVVTPGSTSMARSGSDSATIGSDLRAAAPISWTVIPADSSKRVLGAAALGLDRDARSHDRLRSHHDLDLGRTTIDAHLLPGIRGSRSGATLSM